MTYDQTDIQPGTYWARGQRVILTKGQSGVPYYEAAIEIFETPESPRLALLSWLGTTNTEFVHETFAFLRAAGCHFKLQLAEDTTGFGECVFRVYVGWHQPKKDGRPVGERYLQVKGLAFEKTELSREEKRQVSISLKDHLIASASPRPREFKQRQTRDNFDAQPEQRGHGQYAPPQPPFGEEEIPF